MNGVLKRKIALKDKMLKKCETFLSFLFNFFFLLCPEWRGNGFLWFSTEIKNFLEGSADATLNLDQLLCSCGEGRNSLGRMVHNVQAAWL